MSNHTNAYKCYRFRLPHCLIESSCSFSLKIYLVLNRYPRFSPDTLFQSEPIHSDTPNADTCGPLYFCLDSMAFLGFTVYKTEILDWQELSIQLQNVHCAPCTHPFHIAFIFISNATQIPPKLYLYMYHLSIIISFVIACLP